MIRLCISDFFCMFVNITILRSIHNNTSTGRGQLGCLGNGGRLQGESQSLARA
eukprot:Pgem_evm1s8039